MHEVIANFLTAVTASIPPTHQIVPEMHEVIANFLTAVTASIPPTHQIVPDGCRIVQSPTGHHQMIVEFHIEPRQPQEEHDAIE